MKAGFIGLGNIGAEIARNLVAPDIALNVFDVFPAATQPFAEAGAKIAATPAEMAAACDVIGVCVRDDDDVRVVMEGPDGILSSARDGLVVAIHSTIKVATIVEVAQVAARRGVQVIDAPVTRGGAQHGQRSYIFMLGGEEAALAASRPYFERVALKTVDCGPAGAAMAAKLCNNYLTFLNVAAFNELAPVAEAAGLDLAALAEVLSANGIGNAHVVPLLRQRAGQSAVIGDGKAQPSHAGALAAKDLGTMLALGEALGFAMPLVASARDSYLANRGQ